MSFLFSAVKDSCFSIFAEARETSVEIISFTELNAASTTLAVTPKAEELVDRRSPAKSFSKKSETSF